MSVITIPFDSDTGRYRRGLVPICISEIDGDGHRIAPRWIEAVVPIADYLRKLARERIGAIWRVSEVAELSVHAQWRKHRENFGNDPHRRIAAYAGWAAEDLRCGGARLRRGLDILLGDGDKSIIDPLDYQARFENNLDMIQLRNGVKQMASNHAALILDMVVSGYKWDEIAAFLGMDGHEQTVATLRRRHSRLIRRVVSSWHCGLTRNLAAPGSVIWPWLSPIAFPCSRQISKCSSSR
jgi:hypothetical protein